MKNQTKLIAFLSAVILSLGLAACSSSTSESESSSSSASESESSSSSVVEVTGISLNQSKVTLDVGDTVTLTATVSPEDVTEDYTITWSTSKKKVASVSDDGVVTAKKEGTAVITASVNGYSAECTVTVNAEEVSVTSVSLNKEALYLTVDGTYTLTANILPSDATNQNVTWSTADSGVASVSSSGVVTGVATGSTTVTVTTEDGSYTDSCSVEVSSSSVAVTGVSLNYDALSLSVGDSVTLSATIEPYNATNSNVSWSSSDTSVVSVDSGTVTALAIGNSDVTVTTDDGSYTATCTITVSEEESNGSYTPDTSDTDILIITEAGEYTLERDYKQVYVNAADADVVVNLNGYTLENSENSPIYVYTCNSIDISANSGTTSYIKDTRETYTTDDDSQGKGAIYVEDGDLTLKGKGTLYLTANYYNGVHGKDDVNVKNLTLDITAVHHGIKGNDSVTIKSGTLNICCGGDGLHTENSDVSSKGNQRGIITLSGGTITINSWGDALAASYDAVIEEADSTVPLTYTAKTNTYSSYDGEVIETSTSSLYIKMNSSTYSSGSYSYAAYIDSTWYGATYKGEITTEGQGRGPGGGGSSTYYVYEIEKPTDATSFTLYRFSGSNVTTYSTSSYNAVSDAKAFNENYDMVTISLKSGKISFGSWENYSSSNSNTASVSAKGIKAENEIYITGGTIDLKTYDDGIHANNDGTLENGNTPLGNVIISGGSSTIYASDDAVHADYTLTVSGGSIDVTYSYEGLEGNLINISGGSTYVVATDDGVNAGSGTSTPCINVTGGFLDVTVPSSGDTDGIDSNGTYVQSGGVVIAKGPGSASGMTMGSAAIDTDGTVTISAGTLIIFGGSEQTPSCSGNVTKTLCSSSTVSTGTKTISFSSTSYSTTLTHSTSGCVVYSELGTASLS